jgi:hypothetical protein
MRGVRRLTAQGRRSDDGRLICVSTPSERIFAHREDDDGWCSPNDFTNLDQIQQRLADFEHRYNATARPFQWKFTPADLDDLLARIDQQRTTSPTIPQTA